MIPAPPGPAWSVTSPGTRHLNYHDVAGVMPFLRYIGALGTANAGAFLAYRAMNAMKQVNVVPERTVETIKEDVEWAKDQTA